jgi:hypothetical protein
MEIKENALEQNYESNGENYSNTDAYGSSGTASYTAAKDIIVNISFTNSYVNGDAREISIMLRNEIKAAEALGY